MPKDLINTRYNMHNICVRRYYNRTQLIIDDEVKDEFKGIVEMFYDLTSTIDFLPVMVSMRANFFLGGNMYLYVDDELIVKKFRLF